MHLKTMIRKNFKDLKEQKWNICSEYTNIYKNINVICHLNFNKKTFEYKFQVIKDPDIVFETEDLEEAIKIYMV